MPFEVVVNKQKIFVGFSRGHAQYQVSDTPQTLVERADQRLYAEKQARKRPSSREAAPVIAAAATHDSSGSDPE